MKTSNKDQNDTACKMKWFIVTMLFIGIFSACNKDDNNTDEGGFASSYSGTGNFNFTGDFNMSYIGNAENVQITETNGQESLPISFINSQGQELFIGLRSSPLETREYIMKEIDSEGYAAIFLGGNLYDSGAIGGIGTVTLTKLNRNRIAGSVDMRLARPLNTADTVVVKGTFELIGQ